MKYTEVRLDMKIDLNDTYQWLAEVVRWGEENCPSFRLYYTLEPYICRIPGDLHYKFRFADKRDATLFVLRWSV